MRLLIVGGSGMLGHKLWQTLSPRFDTYATFHQAPATYARFTIFDQSRMLGGVAAEKMETVERAFGLADPGVVVNCVGIVKQGAAAKDPVASIGVNALFPHRLARVCRESGARLIQVSTDCVFSGRKGNYCESDATDADDLYGRTKALGELDYDHCLTLRTSMIGRELHGSHGLLEWFLSQRGKTVRGFKRAVFSGFTTAALADVIGDIIADHSHLRGVWHVASDPINKLDLLSLLRQTLDLDIEIEPDESFVCDRSLDGARFREATDFDAPSWPEMIARLRDDPTPYNDFRRIDADR